MSNATTTEIIINNANINQWLYIIFFVGMIGITIYKLYLIIKSFQEKDDNKKKNYVLHWLLFISSLLFWGLLLVLTMIETSVLTYSVLQNFSNLFLVINVFLMIISVIRSFDFFGGPNYSKGNNWTDRF
jgi:hypothetical protein